MLDKYRIKEWKLHASLALGCRQGFKRRYQDLFAAMCGHAELRRSLNSLSSETRNPKTFMHTPPLSSGIRRAFPSRFNQRSVSELGPSRSHRNRFTCRAFGQTANEAVLWRVPTFPHKSDRVRCVTLRKLKTSADSGTVTG